MRRHPHAVARTQRGHRLRLDPSAGHQVQLVALRQQGEHERQSQHQRCDRPADSRLALEAREEARPGCGACGRGRSGALYPQHMSSFRTTSRRLLGLVA